MNWWPAVGYGVAAYVLFVVIPFALAVRHGEQQDRRDRAARQARRTGAHTPAWARTDHHNTHRRPRR